MSKRQIDRQKEIYRQTEKSQIKRKKNKRIDQQRQTDEGKIYKSNKKNNNTKRRKKKQKMNKLYLSKYY